MWTRLLLISWRILWRFNWVFFFSSLLYSISLCRVELSSLLQFHCIFFPIQLFIFRTLSHFIACSLTEEKKIHLHCNSHGYGKEKWNGNLCHGNWKEVSNMYTIECFSMLVIYSPIQNSLFIFFVSPLYTVKNKNHVKIISFSFFENTVINWIMLISLLFALNYRRNNSLCKQNCYQQPTKNQSINQFLVKYATRKKNAIYVTHILCYCCVQQLVNCGPSGFCIQKFFSGFGDFSQDWHNLFFYSTKPTESY